MSAFTHIPHLKHVTTPLLERTKVNSTVLIEGILKLPLAQANDLKKNTSFGSWSKAEFMDRGAIEFVYDGGRIWNLLKYLIYPGRKQRQFLAWGLFS